MPFVNNSTKVQDYEKDYECLYDELIDKCHPKHFIGENFDLEKFEVANRIYGELKQKKSIDDCELITIRDRAMDELGIHISTKKKYEYLLHYFNPERLLNDDNYDMERISESGRYYDLLQKSKDDIRALEKMELEAKAFIDNCRIEDLQAEQLKLEEIKREQKEELDETEEPESLVILAVFVFLFVITWVIVKQL